ncbi:hypothetical protein NEFER03_0797 [Nematocida sp. LUAm3]|nr:hypothetical protein NEFER03_0797 [Nematocida sp. LUAm3]KAI5174822.1 hypothetical protein NEFER02_0922 [Nematocida sp. LUAm2]KAI5177423.1 hypothetical protein NEFER01_0673 [Nematocida sp. LUAm1]
MDELQKKIRKSACDLSVYQRDQLDAYFYNYDIKLTKKNLKIVSKVLNIPHRKIVEYVNLRQRETRENIHEIHLKMTQALGEINMQIQKIWNQFDRSQ